MTMAAVASARFQSIASYSRCPNCRQLGRLAHNALEIPGAAVAHLLRERTSFQRACAQHVPRTSGRGAPTNVKRHASASIFSA
ncbi:hypothetical protein BS50DRAFT_261499 [Corynespora cassiicola Philippines]|uniref:Uncharacterized protein n=1 Tax=Corynespora cassiicola Philippines TaxID=1448308 RepID=A0A2T2N135_CORCC|nr:hypothetical protein BS50DRAFT_261499 [Corynespora cassiicola Philippines]